VKEDKIMNYEKVYKDALERAKDMMENKCSSEHTKTVCQDIFPELAESEDERIRKELIDIVQKSYEFGGFTLNSKADCKRYIAYLEKQKDIITDYEDKLDRCACDNFNKGFKAGVEKQKSNSKADFEAAKESWKNSPDSKDEKYLNSPEGSLMKAIFGDK